MSFFAILCALLIEQVRPLAYHNPVYGAVLGWTRWTSRNFDAGRPHHGWVAWGLAVGLPSLIALGVHWLLLHFLGLAFAMLWSVAVLYATLGFRQFSHHFTGIRDALDMGDEALARSLLARWQRVDASDLPRSAIVRHVIEYSVIAAHRHERSSGRLAGDKGAGLAERRGGAKRRRQLAQQLDFRLEAGGRAIVGHRLAPYAFGHVGGAIANVLERPLGSGEGLIEAYLGTVDELDDNGKPRKVRRQVNRSLLATLDEGQALGELGSRKGATLLPTIRSAWTGDALGQANASEERPRHLPGGAYRFALVAGFQTEHATALLDDVAGGTRNASCSCLPKTAASPTSAPSTPARSPGVRSATRPARWTSPPPSARRSQRTTSPCSARRSPLSCSTRTGT